MGFVKDQILDAIRTCKITLLALIYLFSRLVPIEKGFYVFLCNEAGTFGGNIGPLVAEGMGKIENYIVLSSSPKTVESLAKLGVRTSRYGKPMALWYILRAEKLIIECGMPLISCVVSTRKKVFQMWHGANLKYIVKLWDGLRDMSDHSNSQLIVRWIKTHIPKYEFILATSEFFAKNTFEKSFNSKRVFVSGYPRCDVFFRETRDLDFVSLDQGLFNRVKNHSGKVIAYAPTWRDNGGVEEEIFPFDRSKLKTFLEENNYLMVVKKHHRDKRSGFEEAGNRVLLFPSDNDIYPLFKYVDLMVSDYSSIFFDFLLLDKPALFYTYDYDQYMNRDRAFQYDYNEFTPGRKCREEDELYEEIHTALIDSKYYQDDRDRVVKKVFGDQITEKSAQVILEEIIKS